MMGLILGLNKKLKMTDAAEPKLLQNGELSSCFLL